MQNVVFVHSSRKSLCTSSLMDVCYHLPHAVVSHIIPLGYGDITVLGEGHMEGGIPGLAPCVIYMRLHIHRIICKLGSAIHMFPFL